MVDFVVIQYLCPTRVASDVSNHVPDLNYNEKLRDHARSLWDESMYTIRL
jgi:hypothetical protein